MNFQMKQLPAWLPPLTVCCTWLLISRTLVSLAMQHPHLLTLDTVDKRNDSSPYIQPFCHEHDEVDIYAIVANTAPLLHNVPDDNVRNTMLTRSALEGMQYFMHVCLTYHAYFFSFQESLPSIPLSPSK